jgi:hypothetical protein
VKYLFAISVLLFISCGREDHQKGSLAQTIPANDTAKIVQNIEDMCKKLFLIKGEAKYIHTNVSDSMPDSIKLIIGKEGDSLRYLYTITKDQDGAPYQQKFYFLSNCVVQNFFFQNNSWSSRIFLTMEVN